MVKCIRGASLAALCAVGCLVAAEPAAAAGPCGIDSDTDTACPITATAASYSGTLTTDGEDDYYVFYAQAGTQLSLTITDTEDPSCAEGSSGSVCGDVGADLLDANENDLSSTDDSTPMNGARIPTTLTATLQTSGTYYVDISGDLGADGDNNPTPVPYTLTVTASPGIQWPSPSLTPTPAPVTPTSAPGSGSGSASGPTATDPSPRGKAKPRATDRVKPTTHANAKSKTKGRRKSKTKAKSKTEAPRRARRPRLSAPAPRSARSASAAAPGRARA